jgi:hypothetical protein
MRGNNDDYAGIRRLAAESYSTPNIINWPGWYDGNQPGF